MQTHTVQYTGTPNEILNPGEEYKMHIQPMSGKYYDEIDFEWKDDTRVMVWIHKSFTEVLFYKVYKNMIEMNENFMIVIK